MTVDSRGNLVFRHLRDPSWNLNDYILELRAVLSTWRDVYWRLWGTVNFLSCSRCGETFPCVEIGHCRFHPEPARFDSANDEKCVGARELGGFKNGNVLLLKNTAPVQTPPKKYGSRF